MNQSLAIPDLTKRPQKRLYEGDQWARVRVKRVFKDPKVLLSGSIVEEGEGELHYVLACACGHEWTVPASKFQGKRNVRACGSADCPYVNQSGLGRPPVVKNERGAAFSIYLPVTLMDAVRGWADKEGVSASRAVERLLRAAIDQL